MKIRERWPQGRLLAVGLAAILLLAAAAVGGRQIAVMNASAAPSVSGGCDRVPANKCNPTPTSGKAVGPQPITPVAAQWVSPPMVQCGASFFDSSTAGALSGHFGLLSCFRFEGQSTWVIVGSGMPLSGDGVAGGGTMVATETCATSDAACLDPNGTHNFADFAVSYPPKPDTAPGKLESTFGGRLLYLSDAYCGFLVFDISNGHWYGHGSVGDLMSGAAVNAVPTPQTVQGAFALGHPAPAETGACQ